MKDLDGALDDIQVVYSCHLRGDATYRHERGIVVDIVHLDLQNPGLAITFAGDSPGYSKTCWAGAPQYPPSGSVCEVKRRPK